MSRASSAALLQVIAGAGGNAVVAEYDFFGDAAAQAAGQHIFELDQRGEHAVFRRDEPGDAASTAARDNSDFVDWIAIRQNVADQGVAGFVVGRGHLCLFRS